MQADKGERLRREWASNGNLPCDHLETEKEYDFGIDTGDRLCLKCGAVICGGGTMPKLDVMINVYSANLNGLGKNKPLPDLSQKRVTKCVRDALRKAYSSSAITVTCYASFFGGYWNGKCEINGSSHNYRIHP